MSGDWGSSNLLGGQTVNPHDLGVSLGTTSPRFSSCRPVLPGGRHPACGFVHHLSAAEQAPRTSRSQPVEEVLLEGQSLGPRLEGKTRPKGTDRAAKSQPLRSPDRVEFAQRLPGAGGKKGCGKVREWGARQDKEPMRQFFQETGMNSLQQDTCIIGIPRSTGQGSARLHPKSRSKSGLRPWIPSSG